MDKYELFSDLIPYGEDNAIKRDDLTTECIRIGIINKNAKDADRQMRKMLQVVRKNCSILSRTTGSYYKPTNNDAENVHRRNETEKKRAISIFASTKYDGKLYEDYRRGII